MARKHYQTSTAFLDDVVVWPIFVYLKAPLHTTHYYISGVSSLAMLIGQNNRFLFQIHCLNKCLISTYGEQKGELEGDKKRLFAMKICLRFSRFPAGHEPRTARSEGQRLTY